ncbi:hypothetical protein [Asticcacaulis solisilvae]|uniref:hypothetical protein n=1 Tax=Asticcacaulis solisilvae TaxID=1217274 RepID=UPI003FD75D64
MKPQTAAAALPASRPNIGAWVSAHAAAALALLVFALALWPPALLNDTDTWWHLAAGDWMVAHHAVPHADPFSWTFAGKPWVAHEWLSEIILSRAFLFGAWPGVMVLTAACFATGIGLMAREAAKHIGGLALWLLVLIAAALFGPHLLARPHILVLPVMVLWLSALSRAKTPPWAWLPLMTLWANMHGSFIAGLALIAPFALEAVLASDTRSKAVLMWAGFTVAALAAALLTPFGVDGLLFPLKLFTMRNLDGIGEWGPVAFTKPQPLFIAAAALAFAVWRVRPRLSLVRWAVLAGLFAMSLHQQRHEMVLAVAAVLILAQPLGQALGQSRETARPSPWPALAAVLLAAARLAIPMASPVTASDPSEALAHVPAGLAHARVFNAYDMGGYLIRAGIAPYIDSRADLYGPAFLDRYADLAAGRSDVMAKAFDNDGVKWTFLRPDTPMARAMDRLPGWRRAYADGNAVIHVRRDSRNFVDGHDF